MPERKGQTNDVVVTGVFQGPFRPLGPTNSTRTAAFTAASALGIHSGVPASSIVGSGAASGDQFACAPTNTTRVQFCPYGVGASGTFGQYQFIGEKELECSGESGSFWARRPLGKVWGTLNGNIVGAGMPIASGTRFMDAITVLEDNTPGSGIRLATNPVGGMGTVVLDLMNNERLVIEPLCAVPSGQSGNSGATSLNGLLAEF